MEEVGISKQKIVLNLISLLHGCLLPAAMSVFRFVGEGWIWNWDPVWGLVVSQFCTGSSAPEPAQVHGLTVAYLAKEMEVVKGERLEIVILAKSRTRKELPFSFMCLMLWQTQGSCQSNLSCPLGTPQLAGEL